METYSEQTGQTTKISQAGTGAPFLTDEKGVLLRELYALPDRAESNSGPGETSRTDPKPAL
jgi:hypothetical protein